MVLSFASRSWKAAVRVGSRRHDLVLLYDLLRILYEKQLASEQLTLKDLWLEYRARTGVKVNYYTVKRHVDLAVERGLVEKAGTRPALLKVTKKGIDYMFLFERLSELIK